MRVKELLIPDALWSGRRLPEGAKLLWCWLAHLAPVVEMSFQQLRTATGLSQTSLRRHLAQLTEAGLLSLERRSLHRITWQLHSVKGPALRLPIEILFDRRLSRGAKWVWGLLPRLEKPPLDLTRLSKLTGYAPSTLRKYLNELRLHGWLTTAEGLSAWNERSSWQVMNPYEEARKADIDLLKRGLAAAAKPPGYSGGQYLLARMVQRLVVEGTTLIENAEVTGLDNLLTGGRLHVDILLSEYGLALEFHGLQHDQPTQLFPDLSDFQNRRLRDLIKAGICHEQGIRLIVVRPHQLQAEQLRQLLQEHLPLRQDLSADAHIWEFLEDMARRYRRKASVGKVLAAVQ